MLFIRANTLFNIRTPSICLISPSILCPSDITIRPSSYPYVPACTLAPVAFYPSFCQLMHKQPPGHYSGIPALVPGGAMCTAGMAMLGSAFLQLTGYMLHVSKCSIVIDFCTKPCQAGLFSISAMSVVGGISVRCKTRLQVPDSRVRAWSQQCCLRRDKIQYFGKVLQNSPLTSHKMRLNRAILTMTLPCQ